MSAGSAKASATTTPSARAGDAATFAAPTTGTATSPTAASTRATRELRANAPPLTNAKIAAAAITP